MRTTIDGATCAPPNAPHITVTEFVLPNGRQQKIYIEIAEGDRHDVVGFVATLVEHGLHFEAEVLTNGLVHIDVSALGDEVALASVVCVNSSSAVRQHVGVLVRDAVIQVLMVDGIDALRRSILS